MGQLISDHFKDSSEEVKEVFQVLYEMINSIVQAKSEKMRYDALADKDLPLLSLVDSKWCCFVNAESGVGDKVSKEVGSLFDGKFMEGFKKAVTAALEIFLSNPSAGQQELKETYVVYDREALIRINLYYYRYQFSFKGVRKHAQNIFCYFSQIGVIKRWAVNPMVALYQILKSYGRSREEFMHVVADEETERRIDFIANERKETAIEFHERIDSSTFKTKFAAKPDYLRVAMQGDGMMMETDKMTPFYVWSPASIWIQYVQDNNQKGKGFYEKFNDKEVATLLIIFSMTLFKLLKDKKAAFKEERFPGIKDISKKSLEMLNTFFIKKHTGGRPPDQFEREFFATTHCLLNKVEIVDVLEAKLYEVIRLIRCFQAAEDSPGDENFVKMYIQCLENAYEKQKKRTEVVTFFISALDCLKNFPMHKGEFTNCSALKAIFKDMLDAIAQETNEPVTIPNGEAINTRKCKKKERRGNITVKQSSNSKCDIGKRINSQINIVQPLLESPSKPSSIGKRSRKKTSKGISRNKEAWPTNTALIVGDSMISNVDAKMFGHMYHTKVRAFNGLTIGGLHHHIKPLLKKQPGKIILLIGTNDLPEKSVADILKDLNSLLDLIYSSIPNCKIIVSELIRRKDVKAFNSKVREFNRALKTMNVETLEQENITSQHLGRKGLHLNSEGDSQLAENIINKLRFPTF